MDKLLKLLLGRHQASSIGGLVLALLYNFVGGEGQLVTDPKVLIVSAIVFFFGRFLGETPPGAGASAGSADDRTTAPLAQPGRHQPTPYEQQLMREVETTRKQRDAVIEDAALLRRRLDYTHQQLEAHRANTQAELDRLPVGSDVLRER